MLSVDDLKGKFEVEEDQQLAEKLGKSAAAISKWRKYGVPALAERKALELLSSGNSGTSMQVNGNNHHIDIHHAGVTNETPPNYNSANSALKGIAETLPENRVWELVKIAAGMKSEEEGK